MDYGRELMEELKKIRNTDEVNAVTARRVTVGLMVITLS